MFLLLTLNRFAGILASQHVFKVREKKYLIHVLDLVLNMFKVRLTNNTPKTTSTDFAVVYF